MPELGGVVIITKKLTNVLDIRADDHCLLAQSGIANTKISQAVESFGLHFAPDPSSQSVSTLGGNIAENSGGPHTLKYGVTVQHILGVTMVDSSGEICRIGGPCGLPPGYDLLSVIVGSEGTLGIVTEAWVKLTPNPQSIQTLLFSFPTIRSATESVAAIIKSGVVPAALEMMDRHVLKAVSAAFPLDYPPGTEAMLLVECDGSAESALAESKMVETICLNHKALQVEWAQNADDRARLWTARKKGIGAMGRIAPTVVTHDGVIPPSRLPEMLEYVYQVAEDLQLGVANIFHAGDGNLHPIFYFDDRIPGTIDKVVEAGEKVIGKCLELGGSVTGEHGVGVEKSSLLEMMFDEDSLNLQKQVRTVFESSQLCNPCKVVPDAKGCIEHKVRWRGAAT